MPATRDANLRQGDLAEGLGLELLRQFAFVAPVPRTEDVGTDAVATLMGRDGRKLFAEDSFWVQVKSASVRTLELKEEKLDWFRALSLPFYLLSVDLATTTFELRTTINATGHPNFKDQRAVTMYLDGTPFQMANEEMHVCLGPPVLQWTPADAVDSVFRQTAYEVLKTWITFEMRCIALRSLGMTYHIEWETNHNPKSDGSYTIMHRGNELKSVLESISPYIQRLAGLIFPSLSTPPELHMGLILISKFMRQQGVDPDPRRILDLYAQVMSKNAGDFQNVDRLHEE